MEEYLAAKFMCRSVVESLAVEDIMTLRPLLQEDVECVVNGLLGKWISCESSSLVKWNLFVDEVGVCVAIFEKRRYLLNVTECGDDTSSSPLPSASLAPPLPLVPPIKASFVVENVDAVIVVVVVGNIAAAAPK